MEFKHYLNEEAKKTNNALKKYIPKKADRKWINFLLGKPEFAYDLTSTTLSVNKPIWDFIWRGGKRWRPALMMLCCSAVGGKPKKYLDLTVLPELVHNGTIMVDDVEDNSVKRRGKPCTHKKFGVDIAINDGNLLYFVPLALLYRNKKRLSQKKIVSIYNTYAEEMLKLSFGQGMDILWHKTNKKQINEAQYLQMCSYKTGTLARMAAQIGAILGNGTKKQIKVLGEFASAIGVAFQIQDDILNLFPKTGWGKEMGDDISEGKQTLLVIRTLKHASKKDAKKLKKILSMRTKNKRTIKQAIAIIEKYDAVDYSRKKAAELMEKSWKKASQVLKKSRSKEHLEEFAKFLISRQV